MQIQKFKGDETELKMIAAATTAMDVCSASLDEFLDEGFSASPYLLMLYDQGRMPFSDRVTRDAFVSFIKEALVQFPFTGTFNSYIFIINKIFGDGSGVLFDVTGPGKLSMLVNASASIEFNYVGRELVSGQYEYFEFITSQGDQIVLGGISGVDSEYKLGQLLSEIIPDGISPDITLAFFAIYNFLVQDGSGSFGIVDHLNNELVFLENGD